jgi:hypothetical protein
MPHRVSLPDSRCGVMFPRVLNSEEVELGLAVSCSRQQEMGKFLAKSSAGRRWIGSETEGSSSPCARESSLHINLFAVVVNHVCCKGAKRKTWLSTYLQRIMRAALAFEQLPSGVCQERVHNLHSTFPTRQSHLFAVGNVEKGKAIYMRPTCYMNLFFPLLHILNF